MARIPDSEIDRIKSETDLVALIQSRGVSLRQQGTNWTGLCPFHQDSKTPNLIVTPGKGLFRCMASGCGATGNAIQFVERFDGLSFRHAFELLANGGKAAFEHAPDGPRSKASVPRLPCPLEDSAGDAKLLEQVANYYASRFSGNEGEAARGYLAGRGLDDPALWKRFGIGLSDRTLGLRIPSKNRKQGAEIRERLEVLGVYRKTGREHLNGCLVVPVRNVKGDIVQLYGRRIGAATPKNQRHLYLARPLGGIFNADALKHREIILTESILDALTFIRHGSEAGLAVMEAATCTFGTANFTAELFEAIRAAKVESVRLAFDADEAGQAAEAEASKRLQAVGIECHTVKLPWGMDVNQYALEQGPEALRHAVRSAAWIGKTVVNGHAIEPQKPEVSAPSEDTQHVVQPLSLAAKSLAACPDESAAKKEDGPSKAPAFELVKVGDYHEAVFGSRVYRIGGLEKNNSLEVLKITLRMTCEGLMHVDSLDLYRDGERRKFIDRAAEETTLEKDLIKRDLGKLLLALEVLQESRLNAPREEAESIELSSEDEVEALELLRSPNLLKRIVKAYDEAGIVGEETNLLAAYLACASRKLNKPLAVIIQSTSAAGKSTLMDAVLAFFPDEEQVKYSAMTGQSLYYLGESNLKHKILAIVEEEGAEKASYALKLLQSEGELTIASTGKDPHSGRMETQEYHVEGPVAIVFTTTSIDIDEELMNRCLVLTVDESRDQTERIHKLQREARTIEGILSNERRKDIVRVMQNAQRLLEPMRIANPFARELTFTSGRTRTRRDHEKYLTLIDTIALLHQHQREAITHEVNGREVTMLPVTLDDIEAANRIAPEVLGRSLDELPPQTRRLLESIKTLVRAKMKAEQVEQRLSIFSRRELREFTGWSETQTRLHLERLEAMEYVHRRGGRQGSACKYDLITDADEPEGSWHVGLIDVAKLRRKQSRKPATK
ncbi:CHC2 zinc finger domain-containing protein [Haloferula chungangensis]|uniref:CHC2 zinc finger domain-containing protein n=1 Tax=Haloferula chungangensis TaxID=1048331 RepID=A0ABW2LB04_9BACT